MQEKRKASISVILVMVFVLGLFIPMSQHARAAIPVPHNQYGHALDIGGVNFSQGETMSAWIDGVMYGWNLTFDDILDPEYPVSNYSSKIDIDTVGNQVTIPGDPDTPWVKEGGDHNIDDIMYVWGDMTEYVVNLGSASTIFEQTVVWTTFDFFYSNLTIAPTQPSALPKINNIVTLPGLGGTQYIYIFGPPGTSMDDFYLEKNDGVLHNVATQIFLSGTISETMYFYVDLGATDYLTPLGDELKLVWENPGGPGTPFGGMDVVVDRVEYNATAGGTHYGEPDNTIMPDAVPPGPGFDIHRGPMPGFDTNDCSADFSSGGEPGRPPEAPYDLSVEGLLATGPGQTISPVTNRVNPLLGWTHTDPDSPPSPQFGYRLEIATDPAFAAVTWSSYQPASGALTEVYSGPAFSPGVCYYYRARTKDAFDYGPWADTEVCMNTPPPVPANIWPANETISPVNVVIYWSIVTDAEGHSIMYEVQADDDILFTPPYEFSETTSNNFSSPHTYPALSHFWYRVRAHDGYEYSAWSSDPDYWWFDTTNPPIEPEAQALSVEGFSMPSPEADHLTNRLNPVFSWTFYDANSDLQQAYNMEIRDAPGGFGNLIWSDSGGAAEQVTYAGVSQLAECMDYWFRVEVQDDSASQLWSLAWAEGSFHSNCIPTVPVLIDPPDQSLQPERAAQSLIWLSSTDLDVLDSITYEWSVEETCPPGAPTIKASGTTDLTTSATFATTAGCFYNWTVRAGDGWEWSAWATTFMFYIEVPKVPPGPATNLAVDGFTAAPGITHLLNPTPTFSWTFNDPDPGDWQAEIHVMVRTGPGGTGTIIWDLTQAYTLESIVYGGGINPEPCNTYYFRILTADNNGLWADDPADWSEIMFAMNCPPTVPQHDTPADTAVLTPSATQVVTWLASTDPGDTITYTVQVDDSSALTAPFVLEEETTGLTSSGFDTTGLGCFWWRVNATDGYESSAWSTPFSFCANNAPGDPINLAVEGETTAPNITHIFAAEPAFNWTFVDPDGHTQTAFELSVWTGTGGTGTEMWSYTGGTAETVDYNVDSTATALELAVSYYFRVRGMDAYEFGVWAELMFELNGPPPAPTLTTPADVATGVSLTPDLTWASGGADPNGDTVTYFWYVDTDAAPTPLYTDSNSTTGTTATVGVTLAGSTLYYWMVCADDTWEQNCSAVWSFTTMVANADPIANAGTDQTVEEGDTVTLTGTGTDSDGTITLYEWDFTSDGTYDHSDATSGTTTHVYAAVGTYTATLRVTDDDGATGTDTVVITVTAAPPPTDEKGFLEEYWWVLLIIAIIVIFVIILLAKRKKPEEEEEAPAEEEEEPPPPDEEAEEAPEEEAEEEGAADMKECANCGTVLAADDAECFMCGAKV